MNNYPILYEYIRGSKCHGISTPSSDTDIGGVFLAPIDELIGIRQIKDTIEDSRGDIVHYEFGKYMRLLLKSNPTVLESLFVDEKFVTKCHPMFREILAHKEEFISKDCFPSIGGYAISQISKAKGLNKKIHNPVTERLDILDFCYTTIDGIKTIPIKDFLKEKRLDEKDCGLVRLEHMNDAFGVHICKGLGICSPNRTELRMSPVPKDSRMVCMMTANLQGFSQHCREYKEYKEWEKNRNPVRYLTNIGKNYDAKNMCECFRLLHMGTEIANGEGVHVNRQGRDAGLLLDIKAHKFSFDEIQDMLTEDKAKFDEAVQRSTIREHIDQTLVDNLTVTLRRKTML